MKQVDVQAAMAKISENVDLYNIDIAIDKFEDYLTTTENQITHLKKEHERIWHVVETLKRCRELVELNPPKKADQFEKI